MIQRVVDFCTAKSLRTQNLSITNRLLLLVALLMVLAIPTVLCGSLVSFKVAFQMWLFVLAAAVPLVGGLFLISKYHENNQKLSFLLATGLLGFVAFTSSLVGMLIDERASNFGLGYILSNAVLIGAVIFIITTLGYLLFAGLTHLLGSKK